MKRLRDVLCGFLLGVNCMGMFDCFIMGNLNADDFSFHFAIIVVGILSLMINFT